MPMTHPKSLAPFRGRGFLVCHYPGLVAEFLYRDMISVTRFSSPGRLQAWVKRL